MHPHVKTGVSEIVAQKSPNKTPKSSSDSEFCPRDRADFVQNPHRELAAAGLAEIAARAGRDIPDAPIRQVGS
jgi:hypothetical protein